MIWLKRFFENTRCCARATGAFFTWKSTSCQFLVLVVRHPTYIRIIHTRVPCTQSQTYVCVCLKLARAPSMADPYTFCPLSKLYRKPFNAEEKKHVAHAIAEHESLYLSLPAGTMAMMMIINHYDLCVIYRVIGRMLRAMKAM